MNALLLLFAFHSSYADDLKFRHPVEETIPDGPKIAWFQSDKLPLVDWVWSFPAGLAMDPEGKSGTATFLAEMMEQAPALEEAESLGAKLSVTVSEERLTIMAHGLSRYSEKIISLLLKFTRSPPFETAIFEREKKRMLERWDRIGDSVPLLASFLFSRLISSGTVYGRGGALSPTEIRKIELSDLKRFHASNVVARGSLLIGVGDLEPAKLKPIIQEGVREWGGKVEKKKRSLWSLKGAIRPERGVTWLVDRPGAAQTEIRLGFPVPSFKHPDREALSIANALIGETFTSRLVSKLRDEEGLVYGIQSGISHELDFSYFMIQTATHTVTTVQALEGIEKIWKDLHENPPSDEEIGTAREYLIGSFPMALKSLTAVVSKWMSVREYGLGDDYLEQYVSRLRAVTPKDVRRVIEEDLQGKMWTRVLAGDAKTLSPLLRVSGRNIKVKSAADLRGLQVSASHSRSSGLPK